MNFEYINLFLRQCKNILKLGGSIICRVPSGDSPFARANQYGDITHKSVFGSSAVLQIAIENGLDLVSVRSPAFPLLGQGIITFARRIFVLVIRSVIFLVIAYIFMGNSKVILTPNLLFVLQKKI